ncbi:hypothetical protein NFI96_031385 [Prochilodus magdalenae]|nr:hypothetical protein NFI96_031385 [Prochilodus magdalenae]
MIMKVRPKAQNLLKQILEPLKPQMWHPETDLFHLNMSPQNKAVFSKDDPILSSKPEKADKETNTEKEIPDWEKMLACKVAVKPDTSSTSFLEFGRKMTKVTCKSDAQDKTEFVHVLCEERFSSGRYYWEIKPLIEPYTTKDGKTRKCSTSWYVGVTSESAEKKRKVPVNPQNGYWVLQYDRDKGYHVNDPSLTPVLVRDRFSKLGVFIDCEKHTLSFYDCDKQTHLYTFYNVPSTSPLIPVLSPGDKKEHTIIICQ